MKHFIYIIVAIISLSCALTACHGNQTRYSTPQGDTLKLHYAKYLTIIEHKKHTEVLIHSPWNTGRLLQTVIINVDTSYNEISQPSNPSTLKSTPERAVFFTTTHSNLIEELGCIDAIAGICETEYIANLKLCQAINEGKIKDMGSAMTPDRERIISINPDVILLSPYENASTYGNLETLGIPIIQCADYMENSALGRAEWIRFYGRLFGKANEADSLFKAIDAEYKKLRVLTDSIADTDRPTVLFDTRNGSAWYVPGGRSTMAQLVADAGGHYIFSENTKSGSVPLSFESVLSRGGDADTWLIRYSKKQARMSMTDLAKVYEPYTLFKAYREGNVYGCNSTDLIFYEETPFHPERLLRDYINILHPNILSGDTLRYFHKL